MSRAEAADGKEEGACWSQHGEPTMSKEEDEGASRPRCMYTIVPAI
jgi:hypothetical protein